jgi:hypothetical protein
VFVPGEGARRSLVVPSRARREPGWLRRLVTCRVRERACRTSRNLRHLTGSVGQRFRPATICAAPDLIAGVSAHTRSQLALTPHTPDAHIRQVDAARVEPIVSAHPPHQTSNVAGTGGETRQNRNRYLTLTPLIREREGSRAPSTREVLARPDVKPRYSVRHQCADTKRTEKTTHTTCDTCMATGAN